MSDEYTPRDSFDFDRELEQLLTEAEETVVALRREYEQRKHAAQHAEIDRLEEHMAAARVRWSEVRMFLEDIFKQLAARDTPRGES